MALPYLLLWVHKAATTHPAVGGGRGKLRHDPIELERELERERPFSRKRFDELRAAERAQAEAERKASELKASKRQKALAAAAKSAAEAIRAVHAAELDEAQENTQLVAMTLALEGAASATKADAAIREAIAAQNAAKLLLGYLAELEDEEAAVMLLLN